MKLIDGNLIAQTLLDKIRKRLEQISSDIKPKVVFIRVGEDPASVFYVRRKRDVARQVGIESELCLFGEDVGEETLLAKVRELNEDNQVSGILVQAPLPNHIDAAKIFNAVDPAKDVDGFSTMNLGKLCQEDSKGFVACTPAGILEMLKHSEVPTSGKHVVVLGRSLIVGKPAALLMLQRGLDATVTLCHSRTENLKQHTAIADIIIVAVGRPATLTADMIKPGAVVIDVGINRIDDATDKRGYKLVGDVDFEGVSPLASQITPVPGGVGPMTVAMLMSNTLKAFEQQREL